MFMGWFVFPFNNVLSWTKVLRADAREMFASVKFPVVSANRPHPNGCSLPIRVWRAVACAISIWFTVVIIKLIKPINNSKESSNIFLRNYVLFIYLFLFWAVIHSFIITVFWACGKGFFFFSSFRYCSQFVPSWRTQTQMIHWCQKLLICIRQTRASMNQLPGAGPKNMPWARTVCHFVFMYKWKMKCDLFSLLC